LFKEKGKTWWGLQTVTADSQNFPTVSTREDLKAREMRDRVRPKGIISHETLKSGAQEEIFPNWFRTK